MTLTLIVAACLIVGFMLGAGAFAAGLDTPRPQTSLCLAPVRTRPHGALTLCPLAKDHDGPCSDHLPTP